MKERLIGAAVLVALGVWFIPWLLDGQGTGSAGSTEELVLPALADPAPMKTQVLRLDEEREVAIPGPVETQPERMSQAAPEPLAPPVAVPQPQPTPLAAAAPSGAPEEPVQAPPAIDPDVATRAPDTSSASSSAPPVAASVEEQWWVQVGSFSEEENARRLAERVGTYGHRARISTYQAGGRAMYRVRVGPESSRSRAEAAASSLSAHGFVAQVVSGG